MNETVRELGAGKVICVDRDVKATELTWQPHASFEGVFLKHLVKGEATGGKFSCHLIRIQSGHAIGGHIHEDKMEFIHIVAGVGRGELGDKRFDCRLGVSIVVPEKIQHSITAGSGDVYLLAKFIPALL
ncbi:MAG: cupin domain-containing protein [Peptococcaceae bacterium]|nr:cupin domain-containing protein [Peptococcaceae bacterium]